MALTAAGFGFIPAEKEPKIDCFKKQCRIYPVKELKTARHVIFLGAGASYGSGYLLMERLRALGLAGTELAQATAGSVRLKLLKI
jgi:hypothetical protein